jgi:hypothetical protein
VLHSLCRISFASGKFQFCYKLCSCLDEAHSNYWRQYPLFIEIDCTHSGQIENIFSVTSMPWFTWITGQSELAK